MRNVATDGMNDRLYLRWALQLALAEFLQDEGFDLTGTSSWEIRVWTGVHQRSVVVSIIAHVEDGTFGFAPMSGGGGSCRVPWEAPFELIAQRLRSIQAEVGEVRWQLDVAGNWSVVKVG